MECDLCCSSFSPQRHPLCASCVRSILYPARIRQARALIDREKDHNHAEAVFRPGNDGVLAALSEDLDLEAITTETRKYRLERSRSEQEVTQLKVDGIMAQAAQLRIGIEQYKQYKAEQVERNSARRRALDLARRQLDMERVRRQEPVMAAIKKAGHRVEKTSARISEARAFLCNQVAMLMGLKKVKRGEGSQSEYWLAGTPLPNLRYLCRAATSDADGTRGNDRMADQEWPKPYESITASFEQICRLLTLCCHYLSVRLPAELILPRNGNVRPIILPEKSSYKPRDKGSSVTMGSSVASLSRSTASHGNGHHRARDLHIDRPLPQLYRDDPKAFQLYTESVMLLAWDVAWLCRTQGIGTIATFEDVCAVGRNLHTLLISSPITRRRPAPVQPISTDAKGEAAESSSVASTLRLGDLSHATVHDNLSGVRGRDILNGWRLSSTTALSRLTDKLANHLLSEMSRQEWDIVDEHEWDEELDDEQPVLVGGLRNGRGDAKAGQPEGSAKGRSGWMKVRGRSEL